MDDPQESGQFLYHAPCPNCGSADNLAVYTDHEYCFGCKYHKKLGEGNAERAPARTVAADLLVPDFVALTKRRITDETCKKFGYGVADFKEQKVHVATYRDQEGNLVAQHVRFPNKDFKWIGDAKNVQLFGQHLWRDGGKMVVITEGEIDCLSVSQVQGNKWPVVSIPNGAQAARKALARNLEWLNGFESVVLMFDNDEPGKKAAQECVDLFKPGQCKVASLPLKDASDMLQADRGKEIIDAIWSAKTARPDGIIDGQDLLEAVLSEAKSESLPYPWEGLNKTVLGMRKGELVTICAGSGIGKSTYCRELAHYLLGKGQTVGYLALEESTKRTALGIMSVELNKRLHISREGITDDDMRRAFAATVGSGRCFLYDHFGSVDVDNLLARIRYLSKGCGCQWIILDHLSIVVSGLGDGDERRLIDNAMTALRSLVEETGVGMFLVSHLKRPPEGKSFNDGRHISLSDLRGSAAIEQLSDSVLGIERNQQDPEAKHKTCIRVLKDRCTGYTGEGAALFYNVDTGRLSEQQEPTAAETEY